MSEEPVTKPPSPTFFDASRLASLFLGCISISGGCIYLLPPVLAIIFGLRSFLRHRNGSASLGLSLGLISLAIGLLIDYWYLRFIL